MLNPSPSGLLGRSSTHAGEQQGKHGVDGARGVLHSPAATGFATWLDSGFGLVDCGLKF